MVVNGDRPRQPSAASNNVSRRLSHEDGQRFKGDPRTLPVVKLSDLSDVHRRQVVSGLRELVQRTCPETVQHLVDKRKNIADVIDVVKQQTNLTFFNLNATGGNGNVSPAQKSRHNALTCNAALSNAASTLSPDDRTKTTTNFSNGSVFSRPKTAVSNAYGSSSPASTSQMKIAPPVLSVATKISKPVKSPSQHAVLQSTLSAAPAIGHVIIPSDIDRPGSNVTPLTALPTTREPSKKRVKLNTRVTTVSPLPGAPVANSNFALPENSQHVETPPPLLSRALVADNSSPTDLYLQQQYRTGISYTRLRTTSGNRSRRGGRSQQRWKSGTIVTHYLALSNKDLADYPDRPSLSDSAGQPSGNDSFMQISIGDCDDISDEGDGAYNDADDAIVRRARPHATSNSSNMSVNASDCSMDSSRSSPSVNTSHLSTTSSSIVQHRKNRRRSNIADGYQDSDVEDSVNVRPEPLSPETAASLHTRLPSDETLLRLLARRYSLKLSAATRRRMSAASSTAAADADDAAPSVGNKYPAAILQCPEGSALVHQSMMRLLSKHFAGFKVNKYLGRCELCKQKGLVDFWPASKRFCSSQCTKRFSRYCQTKQNRLATALEVERIAGNAAALACEADIVSKRSCARKNSNNISNDIKMPSAAPSSHHSAHAVQKAEQYHKAAPSSQHQPISHAQPPAASPPATRLMPTTQPAASYSSLQLGNNKSQQQEAAIKPAVARQPVGPLPFPVDPNVLMGLENKHVDEWSKEEVAQYIAGFVFHVSADIPRQFVHDCIDGQALLMLNTEMLTSTMNIPLGHALKINYAIDELRKTNGFVNVKKLRIPGQLRPAPSDA